LSLLGGCLKTTLPPRPIWKGEGWKKSLVVIRFSSTGQLGLFEVNAMLG